MQMATNISIELSTVLHGLGIDYFWDSQQRIYAPFLLLSLAVGLLFLGPQKHRYFNRSLWWHPSAKLDYLMFALTSAIKLLCIVPVLFSVFEISLFTKSILFTWFGYQRIIPLSYGSLVALYSFTFFIANDLSRYGLHRLMHAHPWLWRVHQTHHSAEVLTPLTFYRVHPIELFLFAIRYMLVAGIVTGLFSYYFGAGLGMYTLLGVHASVWLSQLLLANLRHSHIAIGFGNAIEHGFISPAQHQIHHSQTGNNKNYGSTLAIWDTLFSSLRTSQHFNAYQFGLAQTKHRHIKSLFFLPK